MLQLIPSAAVYVGAFVLFAALVCLVKPISRIGIPTRWRAAGLALMGLATFAGGLYWPAGQSSVAQPRSELDRLMPVWQFGEHHSLQIRASPDRVYRAMREMSADEIALYRLLTWIRSPHFRTPARENILTPGSGPLLDAALKGGFVLVADAPPREIVFGTLFGRIPRLTRRRTPEEFLALRGPGVIRILMNFRIEPDGDGSRIETDTRVEAVDDEARRVFGRYWRVIYPGSAVIRIMWLRAIRARALQAGEQ